MLMVAWLGATLGMVFWPDDWNFNFFGWPFGFWLGAQGVLLIYWAIVAIYARVMSRAEARMAEARRREGSV